MDSVNVTRQSQDNTQDEAPFMQAVSIYNLSASQSEHGQTLADWIAKQIPSRLQERLTRHLNALKQETNSNE